MGDIINISRRSSGGTKWGNPFVVGKDGSRAEVVAKYRRWLWAEIKAGRVTVAELANIAGFGFYCAGCGLNAAGCHGEVLRAASAWACKVTDEAAARMLAEAGKV